jgi:hypothetical protein
MRLLAVNDHALESVGHQCHMLVFIWLLDYQIVRFCFYVLQLLLIFTAFFIYYIWKYLNSAKGENPGPTRTDISGWIVMAFLFSTGTYMIFTGKALPFPFDFVLNAFFSSGFIDGVIMYPMILFWERKNMMTIYFVEEKPSKLRPVAIPSQVLQRPE